MYHSHIAPISHTICHWLHGYVLIHSDVRAELQRCSAAIQQDHNRTYSALARTILQEHQGLSLSHTHTHTHTISYSISFDCNALTSLSLTLFLFLFLHTCVWIYPLAFTHSEKGLLTHFSHTLHSISQHVYLSHLQPCIGAYWKDDAGPERPSHGPARRPFPRGREGGLPTMSILLVWLYFPVYSLVTIVLVLH